MVGLKLRPECPALHPEGLAGGPWGLGSLLGAGKARKARRPGQRFILPRPAPHPSRALLEMSFLQLSRAEVTPAQQITLKVEQCLLARQGWGQWAGGQPHAGWELLPGPE